MLLYKKSVRPYLLPVPQLEALELPIGVERANLQSLTQNMIRQQPMLAHCQPVDEDYSYSHWHLLFATFLTEIEIFQVSSCQERASSKRFPKCLCRIPPALPTTGLCSGGRHGKFKNIFLFLQNNRLNFIELTPGDWDFLDCFALRWDGADFFDVFSLENYWNNREFRRKNSNFRFNFWPQKVSKEQNEQWW